MKYFWVILVIGLLLVVGCGNKASTGNINTAAVITSDSTLDTPTDSIKEFNVVAKQWEFIPDTISVKKGDTVKLNLKSVDVVHGFKINEFNIDEKLNPGEEVTVTFVADKTGVCTFFCNVPCGEGHKEMKGTLIVN